MRWFTDGKYHVVGIEVRSGSDPQAWIAHCRRLPKLRSLRFMGATGSTAASVRRELRNTQVRVEYWDRKWVPSNSES